MDFSRRQFGFGALTGLAFTGLARRVEAAETYRNEVTAYGALAPDPARLLDLPKGFSYQIVSRAGEAMDDGFRAPDNFDGMGCFTAGAGKVALVRNHELSVGGWDKSAAGSSGPLHERLLKLPHFGRSKEGLVFAGGTSTLIVDLASGRMEQQFLSLAGTATNCAGGTTPWGGWLTCEENTVAAPDSSQSHGWVFEIPSAHQGLVQPEPLKAMGRFRHEAACVDPRTGIVYLTEDRDDSLFYRFLPQQPGALARGGRLQALAFLDRDLENDTRNWYGAEFAPRASRAVRWIDMKDVESPGDDLRVRGRARGAVQFARGEGIHQATGTGEVYFTCTSGGAARLGQVMRYVPGAREGFPDETDTPGRLELFVESADTTLFEYGDNLTVSPWGHLIVCEDHAGDARNHLRGITPDGRLYTLARLNMDTELAGACFSPDGQVLFVNAYAPGRTLDIRGPWDSFRV